MDGRVRGWMDGCMGKLTSVPTGHNAQSRSMRIKTILHYKRIHLKRKTFCRHLGYDKNFFFIFHF